MKSGLLAAVALSGLLIAGPAAAQGVKIGILNDQSGVYADYGGKWSFEAAKMAVEDFGGEVLGHKVEVISAARGPGTHSRTMAKHPASSKPRACAKTLRP